MNHVSALVLSTVLGSILSSPAYAADPPQREQQALQTRLDAEEARLLPQRQALQGYFGDAYARYPAIPRGTLEAIAYVQSRWLHLQPDPQQMQGERHHHMPAAHGAMGLYGGEGFADQVAEGARLLGVSPEQVRDDPRINVLAAAALLDREIRADARAGQARTPESIRPALMRYAGFAASPAKAAADSEIGEYARTSFAYDVLLAQDRGVDDRGIKVPERPIEWERAFDMDQLIKLRAPFVRLDVTRDRIETADYEIDPVTETLKAKAPRAGMERAATAGDGPDVGTQSTDYGPARWVASPYHSGRSSYSSVTIHTAQGSYGGTISWFQNNPYSVSAHYVIRSSDGQVTQMVRESRAGHHVGVHNGTTLGIEHEGYVNNSSWYTTAMYNSSAALVRNFCSKYSAISCANAYDGPAHSGVVVLSTALDVKGHQHYSSQTHVDPGINWNWGRYYDLLNPGGGGGGTTILDSFEGTVGHFNTSPAYSGSTTGISTASSATRTCATRRNGNCSLRVLLKDNTSSSASWAVRLLSGTGRPGSNTPLTRAGGKVGFWVFPTGSGMQVGLGIDDSDGTERSSRRSLPANQWTYVSWSLTDAAQWNAWAGGNGAISAGTVKLDALWLYRAQTAWDVNVYIDDVQIWN